MIFSIFRFFLHPQILKYCQKSQKYSQNGLFFGSRVTCNYYFCSIIVCACCRFREKLGVKTVKALKRNNNGVIHAAIDMLCALMCVSDAH